MKYKYPGNEKTTLQGLEFYINQGEIFGFLGPSGAGKSTIQKILIGLLKGYSGSVGVLEQEISQIKADFYEKIGVAFEFPNFYTKFTAMENLSLFRSLYSGDTEEPAALMASVGLDKDAGTRVGAFSKGMKMRLNFCRALLNKPELIFLDEPTSGMDPVNARNIKDIILRQKSAGRTVVITTHNMSVAEEICDRVAFIVDGRIALIDSPRELKIKRGIKLVTLEYRDQDEVMQREFELQNIGYSEEFLHLLRTKNIERMHTQEATLEDIFIDVTGRSLACHELSMQ